MIKNTTTQSESMGESEFECSDSEKNSGSQAGSYIPSSTEDYDSESDGYSESDNMEDDEAPFNLRNRSTDALKYTPPYQQHRSIIAPTSLSQTQETLHDTHLGQSSPFTFMNHECYTCSCLQSPSHPKGCTVLDYLELKFIESWGTIFCPNHNCLIPASFLGRHIEQHSWTSHKRRGEIKKMVEHLVLSCHLAPDQSAGDIRTILPDALDGPLVAKNLNYSHRCPFCDYWAPDIRTHSAPDGNLRRHMKETHKNKKWESTNEEPQLIYRVRIISELLTHVFVLPAMATVENIRNAQVFVDPFIPDIDFQAQSFVAIDPTQDWPILLRWESYAAEINAGRYIPQLRTLIGPPKTITNGSPADALENGLFYVKGFCIRYMKGSGTLVTGSISHIGRVLVSRCVKNMFTIPHIF